MTIIADAGTAEALARYLSYVALDPARLGALDWEDVPNLDEREWSVLSLYLARVRTSLMRLAATSG